MYRKRQTRTHPKKYDLFSGEYAKADHLDKEGHPSFTLPLKHRVLQNLMTNTVQNTFYASQRELAVQSVNLYKEILEQDPEFLAKATVYAREKGYMRLQPIISTIVLSTFKDKVLFHSVFKKAIRTPKDLADFIGYCRKGSMIRHGLGRTVKTAIKEWLRTKLSEYWLSNIRNS